MVPAREVVSRREANQKRQRHILLAMRITKENPCGKSSVKTYRRLRERARFALDANWICQIQLDENELRRSLIPPVHLARLNLQGAREKSASRVES